MVYMACIVCDLFKYYSNKKKEKKNKNYIIINING